MALVTYPLNNIEYSAEDAELYNSTRTSGVFDGKSDFNISIESGLVVSISEGLAWIQNSRFKGKVVALKEPEIITLPAPSGAFPRYDVIAIRFDALQNKSSIVVKSGDVISWDPPMPERSTTESNYELFLYRIYRNVNSFEISETDIKDLRQDPSYCGIMSDPVSAALPVTGGYMKGPIYMDGNLIVGLGEPSSAGDAAPKSYVDRKVPYQADMVVESANGDGWTHRKWSSGIVECWGTFENVEMLGIQSVGDVSVGYAIITMPDYMREVQSVQYTVYNTTGYDFAGKVMVENKNVTVFVCSLATLNPVSTIRIHIIGYGYLS